jgi:hypothetical protein
VPGVGQQGQAPGYLSTNHLDYQHRRGEYKDHQEAAAVGAGGTGAVVVTH